MYFFNAEDLNNIQLRNLHGDEEIMGRSIPFNQIFDSL